MYICLDIETTGLNNETDSIIEFCAIKFDDQGKILDRFQSFVHYNKPIPVIIEHLTGINKSMTENAPMLEEIKPRILELCQDLPIIGHNISFDVNFLKQNGIELNGPLIDTLTFSHIFLGENLSFSLETLTRKFNTKSFPSHRAEDDVIANIELFEIIIQKIKSISPQVNYLFKQILSKADSPLCTILEHFLPAETAEYIPPKIEFIAPASSGNNPTIQNINNFDLSQLITNSTNQDLFVISDHSYLKYKNLPHTKLPEIYSLIMPEKFLQRLTQVSITEDEAIFLCKIANSITTNPLLSKNDLNLFGPDYDHLGNVLSENYLIPTSTHAYITNHYTFFKLLAKNLLPTFANIHFENVPFLEETYIRSCEQKISLGLCENGQQSDELLHTFSRLGIYATRLKAEKQLGEYTPLTLDTFDFTTPEFTEFLQDISANSQNPQVLAMVNELKSNFQSLIVWINLSENSSPSVSFVPQSITFDLKQILTKCDSQTVNIYQADSTNEEFYINIDLNLPDPNDYSHNATVKNWLLKNTQDTTGQVAIVCTAKAQMTELHKHLAPALDKLGISVITQDISGSKGKILDNIANNENPLVIICTQHFLLRNIQSMPKLEKLVLTKLPMTLPNHIYYEYQKQINPNSFNDLNIPASAQTIYQICNFVSEQSPNLKAIELLDKRIVTKDWAKSIADHLPRNIIITQS